MGDSSSEHPNIAMLRDGYRAYAESDLATLGALYSPDIVFHVSGRHPLSGDYEGMKSVLEYMLRIGEITGGRGGFEVETLLADDKTAVAVVTGIAWAGNTEFRRRLMHVNRVDSGQVCEFWDLPYDQHAEDAFWTKAIEPD
jgi:ketosteroid isomerase-like protein